MGPLPQPPAGAMPEGWQVVYTFLLLAPLVGFAAWCVRRYHKERDPVPLLCLAGGAVCVLFEPIVDILGLCWYPRDGQWMLFETLGRPIPVGVLFGYMWAFGGLSAVSYTVLRQKGSAALTRLYPLFIGVSIPFELIANHTGYYVYYGHQPLQIADWPAWWGPVNFAVPITAAVLIHRFRPVLTGPRILAVALLVPMADGAVNGATAWPVWSALNAPGLATVFVQLAGLASVGLAMFLVWLVTRPAALPPGQPSAGPADTSGRDPAKVSSP